MNTNKKLSYYKSYGLYKNMENYKFDKEIGKFTSCDFSNNSPFMIKTKKYKYINNI